MHLVTIGDHLRKRRLDLGLWQKDVAQRIGASVATLVNWELNHHQPEVRFIPEIIEFLGYDPLPSPKTMGEYIVTIRSRVGLTQWQFAKQIAVDQTTLARWERDERLPWGETLLKLRQALLSIREVATEIPGRWSDNQKNIRPQVGYTLEYEIIELYPNLRPQREVF